MWLYFALLSAVLNSFNVLARKTHGSLAHPMELCWWTTMLAIPFGIGLLLTSHQPYYTNFGFVIPLALSCITAIASSVLSFHAFQKGETSALTPITNCLPVFAVVTSFLFIGIVPTWTGLIGILLVVAGVYYSSVGKEKLSHPIKQILRSPGSRSMLACVILWSIGTVLDKISLESAEPTFIMAARQMICFVILSAILLLHPQKHRFRRGQKVVQRWGWHILAMSVFATLAVYFQLQALNLADPAYVMAVKRLDIVFTVLLAHFILKEKHVMQRFEGSLVAFVGIVIICFTA